MASRAAFENGAGLLAGIGDMGIFYYILILHE
jgi:hypothetical protein